ncbi:MAG: hypothetical protein EXQ88_06950 [Alphaproteobacteria bacterium]|nr:hypothetical protein [Alphaproteobacteria bacterium]
MHRGLAHGAIAAVIAAGPAMAGPADVTKVEVIRTGDSYRFDVTVKHDGETPEHFTDRWEVLLLNGTVVGTRVLLQPHPNEQPFTRSLGGVRVPDGERSVKVRARETINGFGGKEITVAVPR